MLGIQKLFRKFSKFLLLCKYKLKKYTSYLFEPYVKYKIRGLTGLRSIQSIKKNEWHHGFAYFIGEDNQGQKSFIKIQVFGSHVLNEVYFPKVLAKFNLDCSVQSVLSYGKFFLWSYVECSYIEGTGLNKTISKEKLKLLYADILKLNKNGIFLRDIKAGNFLMYKGSIYLIDFTYSAVANDLQDLDVTYYPLNCKLLSASLGQEYKNKPFIWDDSEAFLKMMNDLNIYDDSILGVVKSNIGKNYYTNQGCKRNESTFYN